MSRYGVTVYASGPALSETNPAWLRAAGDTTQAFRTIHATPDSDPDVALNDATVTLLGELGEPETLNERTGAWRLDIVWWQTNATRPESDILRLTTALSTSRPVHDIATSLATGRDGAFWDRTPTRWHSSAIGVGGCAVTCTVESRTFVRLWCLCTAASYESSVPGSHSLSSILETDDETQTRGALADYVTQLARERQHLILSMRAALAQQGEREGPGDSATRADTDAILTQADRVRRQHDTHAAIVATGFNLDRTREDLARRLDAVGTTTSSRRPSVWHFLTTDHRQTTEAIATTEFNTHRADSLLASLEAERSHIDSKATEQATRANSLATLLLAVAAGALGAAALVPAGGSALDSALGVGGALFAIGVLTIDATIPYRWAHALAAAVGLGLGGYGYFHYNNWSPRCGAILGMLLGLIVCVAVDLLPRTIVARWLARPIIRRGG